MTRLPPQWLLLRLDPEESPGSRESLRQWLEATLLHLDWHSHLVLAGGDSEQVLSVAEVAAAHVERHSFVTLRFQPCLDSDPELEGELLTLARRFQSRAYREQTEPGLELLPVLTPGPDTPAEALVTQFRRLRARLAEPRLVLPPQLAAPFETALAEAKLGAVRRDTLPVGASGPEAVLSLLGATLVVETAVERLPGNPADTLDPCRPHLVADQVHGLVYPCVRAFDEGRPARPLEVDDGGTAPDLDPPAERCPDCLAASTTTAAPGLAASDRRNEATAAALRVSVALAGADASDLAAACAACAAAIAGGDDERAGALVLEGLCRQRSGDLEGAADRFRQGLAAGVATDERPRVLHQLADCLEQLGRLDEAMAAAAEATGGRPAAEDPGFRDPDD